MLPSTARTAVLFFIFILVSKTNFAQPGNDDCPGAVLLTSSTTTCGGATAGTVTNATNSGIAANAACGGAADDDVWYKFVAVGPSATVTLSNITNGSGKLGNATPTLELFSGTCPSGLVSLACDNSNATTITYNLLTPGSTYYVRIYSGAAGFPASSGTFSICVTNPPPPANDNCSGAILLTSSASCTTTAGTINNGTASTGLPVGCESGGIHYDVWYKFVAASTIQTVTISSPGTSFTNPEIQLYSGACGSQTSIQCGTASFSSTGLTIGNTYYVRVSNIGSSPASNGGFNICITNPPPPPANDDCSGAITLTSATSCSNTAGTLASATATAGLPAGCESGGTHYDVWYSFVAANTAHVVTISGQGINFTNPELQLYRNTCGSLISVACGTTSVSSSVLTVGNTYYVRVSNIGSSPVANGGFNICVTQLSPSVNVTAGRMNEVYKQTILSGSGVLQYPWEITYGPDDNLWLTESRGYKVYRMDPNTGAKTTVLDISNGSTPFGSSADSLTVQFNSSQSPWPQGGLAGLAIHPKFLDGTGLNDYVYVSYVHRYLGGANPTGQFFRNKLVRFTYNTVTNKLESPVVLCDTLPGSSDHNSQRIIIASVTPGGTKYLFYAQGDMGAGQFDNRLRPNNAQNSSSYEGKILRFNLVSDGQAGAAGWIPDDNPYSSTSAVWCMGIRNNQGFAYDTSLNILYGASHGPFSDDEINIIEAGKNYGHPLVIGFAADGNCNGTTAGSAPGMAGGSTSSCPMIVSESANAAAIGSSYKDPLFSGYPTSPDFPSIPNLWNTTTGANALWPTETWSGIDLYTNKVIPGWKHSLVTSSLKWGRLVRLKLGAAGITTLPNNAISDTITYFQSKNRFRDLAFAPNGKDIYVIMDNNAATSGPGQLNPIVPACPGCVQKYTFLGYADASGKSSIPTSIDVTDGTVNTVDSATTMTIDNSNNNLWVPITGPDGNIMAEIYANGNNLGTIHSAFYKNSGSVRIKNTTYYLDRNITITPQTQPSTAVKIRLYISKAEFDALNAVAGLAGNIANLKILKNSDPCSSAIGAATTLLTPTYALAHGANGYVVQYDNLSSFSSFYFSSSNITLPLDLITFSGSLQNNSTVLLKWKTENETNTSHFVVERSIDGSVFDDIGTVSTNGSNSNGNAFNYSFTDADAGNQQSLILYYRLKVVDINGSFKYSNVITISLTDITGKLTVSPNPAVSEVKVNISAPADGRVEWKLIDNTSRVILQNSEHVKKGNGNIFTINMSKLSRGSYYLSVSGAGIDQKVKLQKL